MITFHGVKTYLAIKWVDVGCWMLVGWIIQVCISHQSDLGFYQEPIKLRLVYMDRFHEYLFWIQGMAIFVLLQIRPYEAVLA